MKISSCLLRRVVRLRSKGVSVFRETIVDKHTSSHNETVPSRRGQSRNVINTKNIVNTFRQYGTKWICGNSNAETPLDDGMMGYSVRHSRDGGVCETYHQNQDGTINTIYQSQCLRGKFVLTKDER
jgi:hypothetical protein